VEVFESLPPVSQHQAITYSIVHSMAENTAQKLLFEWLIVGTTSYTTKTTSLSYNNSNEGLLNTCCRTKCELILVYNFKLETRKHKNIS